LKYHQLLSQKKGTNFVPPYEIDECHVDLNISCAEIENNQATDWHIQCVQLTEKASVLSAPTSELALSVDLSAPTKLIADANELCDLTIEADMDHIILVKINEVMARICHAKSLFSGTMDPPMSLSHARDKIVKIPCLKSVYTPNFSI
jgi:hypothetical protein